MANPIEPTQPGPVSEEAKIEPTRNDPTPEARRGDSRFLPVIIVAGITLIILLIGGILVIKARGHKIVPQGQDNHSTSYFAVPGRRSV